MLNKNKQTNNNNKKTQQPEFKENFYNKKVIFFFNICHDPEKSYSNLDIFFHYPKRNITLPESVVKTGGLHFFPFLLTNMGYTNMLCAKHINSHR